MIKIAAPTPEALVRELEEKTNAEPPPIGYAWSVAWGRDGRRTDLDALVPVRGLVPANITAPAFLLVYPEHSQDWLAATLPDDLAVPGVTDRLTAYLGTPRPDAGVVEISLHVSGPFEGPDVHEVRVTYPDKPNLERDS